MRFTVFDPKAASQERRHTYVDATPHIHGGTLELASTLRKGSFITPATPEDCRALIAHLEETLRLWVMPEKGALREATPGEIEWSSVDR